MGLRSSRILLIFWRDDDEEDVWQPRRQPTRPGREVSQFQPLSAKQVKNNLGGYVWQVSDEMKLQRFLFLGADNSFCYKATKMDMKRENARCVDKMISENRGEDVVRMIKNISLSGRAAKQEPTLFALAICARCNDQATKKAAYEALNEICRIPTHLFMFVKFCEITGAGTGWGRAHKRAITAWYENKAKKPKSLARLVTKYKRREDWSHKDLFRLAHTKASSAGLQVVARYVVRGIEDAKALAAEQFASEEGIMEAITYLEGADEARRCTEENRMVELISKHCLEREHITTQLLNSKKVWEALIDTMQMTAIIRNLGKITSLGIVVDGGEIEKAIVGKLADTEALKQARVHPFTVLLALNTYQKGRGDKGSLRWIPNKPILEALDKAYYLSFQSVDPTGKRHLMAVDVSGSMSVPCIGSSSISCRDAAAAMLMVTARTEEAKNYDIVAFSHELRPLEIKKDDKLQDVLKKTANLPFGGTDCALPMMWAQQKNKLYDVFIVYTDNETWYGKTHPSRALQDYRAKMQNPEAKLIVIGMASNGFTIADPNDYGMLDIVGFDSGATQTMAKFTLGEM